MTRLVQARAFAMIACLVGASVAGAQDSPAGHESHHPGKDAPPALSVPPSAPAPGPAPVADEAMQGMRDMMREMMGTGAPRPVYPAMISVPSMSAEARAMLERLGDERMRIGSTQLESAQRRLSAALQEGDHRGIERSVREIREAVVQFESGFSAHRVLREERAPQAPALDWFRSQMSLPAPGGAPGGRAWFHYVLIALFGGFGTTMLVLHVRRVRHAEALLARAADRSRISGPIASRPPPASLDEGAARIASPRANAWSGPLRVVRIFGETPGVKTFRLVPPEGGALPFTYLPGQFLTLSVDAGGRTVKRSYTIASSPARTGFCEITVRRDPQGVVSSYLHEKVVAGDLLQVTGPSGKFTFAGEGHDSIVLIGGGVGVTPMMGVLRYLTDRSWPGQTYFIYGSKSDADVIYRDEIEYLRSRYPNVHVVLTVEHADAARWPHATGVITKELLAREVPGIAGRHVHLCGPPPMMSAVRSALLELGVPAEQIETEVFTGRERASPRPEAERPASASATATFARSNRAVALRPDLTILEIAEDAGVDIEFSCRSGVCGACKVRLLTGTVTMEVEEGLAPGEKAQGYILACQARSSNSVSIDA